MLLGALDPDGGVVTFEELEGSHGGLGGWQVEPFLAHPPDLVLDPRRPVGAPALYRQLLDWMRQLGIRHR